MKNLLLLATLLLGMLSCEKTAHPPFSNADQIIFGYGYPECSGNCDVLYRLTADQIFADACDFCPISNTPFQTAPLPQEKFDIAKSLLDDIPAGLLGIENQTYACPGCDDGIAYFLEIKRDGETHQFRWDYYYNDVPTDFKPYFERVVLAIKEL